MGDSLDLDGPDHSCGRIRDEENVLRLDLGDAPQHDLAPVHLAQLFPEEALGVGHDQPGVAGEGLVDHVMLGIVDLVGDIERADMVGRNAGVGRNRIALAILVRIADANEVVDLVVHPHPVMHDGLVVDEVVATHRLQEVG